MAIEPKQSEHYLSLTTPLGADKLILRSFSGEERLSGPFRFNLSMLAEDSAVDFSKVVGKSATITITRADDTTRYLNGLVARFVQAGTDQRFTTYHAELVPWFWMMTLSADCRIFQNKTVPDIIKAVFSDHGYTDFKDSLTKTYAAREYCVQYRESGFDFCSRLMEEEGIFYFFTHEDGKHTLVLADDASAHAQCPGVGDVEIAPGGEGRHYKDRIAGSTIEQRVTTGKYQTDDYNFETPATQLLVKAAGKASTMQVYDFPGKYDKKDGGEAYAKLRLEAFEAPIKIMRGDGFVQGFSAGHKFTLKGHLRADVNDTWVLLSVQHDASLERYTNSFEAFPASVPFRPPVTTRKPLIPGTQTAEVVGKSGEEIWTDKYGRIKVLFHWDQLGKKDENASCWIRVNQGWAGKTWGAFFLPRIGQEVIVSFVEGDPDRPLVTGAVYNATQTVPYGLPGEQTKSTIKTNVSKGGGGSNELRFEDKKDSEEIYVHAQKDMNRVVENDLTMKVNKGNETRDVKKGNRTTTIDEGNETLTVKKGNRSVEITAGDDTLKIKKGKRTMEVKSDETVKVEGKRTLTVTGNEGHTNKANLEYKVSGNFTLKVDGDITIQAGGKVLIKSGTTLTAQAGTALTTKAGTELKDEAGTNLTSKAGANLTAQGGANVEVKAGAMLTVKGSAMGTVDGGGMLTVKGGLVKIN